MLDAAAYRLDAWITSLADRRLAEIRAAQPDGVAIGGYGWLENLRPATPGATAAPLPDEPGPLVTPAADPGFIHAPSLNQASAAALAVLTGLTPTDSRRAAVVKILGDLQKAIDSGADAVSAEAAFQLARGNPTRAAGALDAISSGQVPPPDLSFAATPRTGTGLTHRVAMVLNAAPGPVPPGGSARPASPRAPT